MKPMLPVLIAVFATTCMNGCDPHDDGPLQGYVEGEFIRLAPAFAGRLQTLAVKRGDKVNAGDIVFTLDDVHERARLQKAGAEAKRAEALYTDNQKGKRESELQAVVAQLAQARAALRLAQRRLERQQGLAQRQYVAPNLLDELAAARDVEVARIDQLQADLTTARQGSREDRILAAQALITAAQGELSSAHWRLEQTQLKAPAAGTVTDYFYRPGEWIAAGSPVVELLPPSRLKLRCYVAEPKLAAVHLGQFARIDCDACPGDLRARIVYVSPTVEFTPPVIFSNNSRSKLVYRVELEPDTESAAQLHPGQPVAVTLQ